VGTPVTVLLSVLIAATIGGVTNYLAIRMLFHPRKAVRVGRRNLPFTPGLIPKRRAEIARALGLVVGDYLVTSSGLRQVLANAEFRQRVAGELRRRIRAWSEREGTLGEWLAEWRGAERLTADRQALVAWSSRTAQQALRALWEERSLKTRTLKELVPDWNADKREAAVRGIAEAMLAAIRQEMLSPAGDALIRRLTARFLEQSGGFVGTLAGLFLDEQKVSAKIRRIAAEQLQSPHVRAVVADMIRKRIEELEGWTLEEALARFAGGDGLAWLTEQARRLIEGGGWLASLFDTPIARLRPQAAWLEAQAEAVAAFVLDRIAERLEAIVAAIDLPKLVEREVSDFPVERLEQIVLNISGKEFRAITWLGALLGGIIGLFQALLFRVL
jgi:uncharacterized membrane protein YheB (UPF0754 family)